MKLSLSVAPRSSRTQLLRCEEGLKLKIAAPPVGGEANKEVCAYIAKLLGLPKSAVSLAAGEKSRKKTLLIEGVDAFHVQALLDKHLEAL